MKRAFIIIFTISTFIQCAPRESREKIMINTENAELDAETYASGCKEKKPLEIDGKAYEYCFRKLLGEAHYTEEVRFFYKEQSIDLKSFDKKELIGYYNKQIKYLIDNTEVDFGTPVYAVISKEIKQGDEISLNENEYSVLGGDENYNVYHAYATYNKDSKEVEVIIGYYFPL